jgi:hypothetical protein
MSRALLTPLVTVAVASLVFTACSSGHKSHGPTSPPSGNSSSVSADSDFVSKVFAAVGAAQSFHVVGSGKDQNVQYSLDVHFGADGGSGFFTQGSARFDLAGHGSDTYVKTTAANWKATIGNKPNAEQLATTLAPHWVRVPTAQPDFAQLLDYVNKDHFVQSYKTSAASQSGPFTKGGTATVSGTSATVYTDTKDGSKIYVAASGAPLLLKVDSAPGDGGGGLTISDYNKPFSPAVPQSSDVVDYTSVVK